MKMIMAIVPRDQTDHLLECLIGAGFPATFLEARGGVLRQAEHIILIAVPGECVDAALTIIRSNCRSPVGIESEEVSGVQALGVQLSAAEVGWATVFVWSLEHLENY